MRMEGWAITGWAAALMAGLIAVSVTALGTSEDATREVVRWSTRFGTLVFAAAFTARPLHQLVGNAGTKWLLRNRRYVGVAFAVMHFTHLAAIGVIAVLYPEPFRSELDVVTLVGGAAVYVLLAGMTITSFDRTAAVIGRRAWKILHLSGAYGLWLVLTLTYVGNTIELGVGYVPFPLLLIAAWATRMLAHFGQRGQRSRREAPRAS